LDGRVVAVGVKQLGKKKAPGSARSRKEEENELKSISALHFL
jgi:hypothetical protein